MGLVVAFGLLALACDGGNDTSNGASNQPPAFDNTVWFIAVAVGGTGDAYVGGDFSTYNGAQTIRIVRLNSNGTIDPAFATGSGFNGSVRSIAPAGNQGGVIYAGGDFTAYNGIQVSRIVRLNANGVFDPVFATGTGFDNTVHSIALAGDGSGDVYVGGAFTNYNGVIANILRLNADGTVDPNFATGAGFNNTVFAVIPVGDGSGDVYVGGAFTFYNGLSANHLVRLKANGTVDPGFVVGTGFDGTVETIAAAGDGTGDVYVGGAFTTYNGTVANGLARLNSNGAMDLTFATGTGVDGTVFSVAPAGGGSDDLYVGGAFSSYNGTLANNLVRVNSNGSVDQSFATGTGFNNTVFRVVPAGDGTGDVYAGGQFTQYQSTPVGRFASLSSTGALVRSSIN
jgi:hypothetical protein